MAVDPLDEECARAMCQAGGTDPETSFNDGSRTAWQIYVGRAREFRAAYDVLKEHERRIESVAVEIAPRLREVGAI